ncbi:hypothetical protein Asi03nite_26840 [Actinoplanes siamensis]|uniref:Uncharacterized protein n=1 Tax=Actinoplanes siamensis TaxID=1223317 RepID=A0A919N6C1_9ACTN|nr:hypothetical protein Asi03nite_26840 [Actinoplanes siamensis]
MAGQEIAQQVGVADVAAYEGESGIGQGHIGGVAGVGQHVQHGHRGASGTWEFIREYRPDIGRTDETGAPGHENLHSGPVYYRLHCA